MPVLRANAIMRAVQLPAGEHTVVMEYRPTAYLATLAFTVLGTGLLGLVLIVHAGRGLVRCLASGQPGDTAAPGAGTTPP